MPILVNIQRMWYGYVDAHMDSLRMSLDCKSYDTDDVPDDIWKTLANDHQSPFACTTKMSQSRKLYAPEEVPKVDWKVLPYISSKWGTGCNDNYVGREALRYTRCKSLESKQTKVITMQLGIEVQRAKEVSRKNDSKMTKGRKKIGERQLNQSLETGEMTKVKSSKTVNSTSPWKTGEVTTTSMAVCSTTSWRKLQKFSEANFSTSPWRKEMTKALASLLNQSLENKRRNENFA